MAYDKYRLKKRRQELGMTQQETADMAGIRLSQYQRFESGDRDLCSASFTVAYRVLKALDMDVEKFGAGEYEIRELIYRGHDGKLYNYETDEPVEGYYGLNEEVVDDFCARADGQMEKVDPEYIAGKVPLAKWLRLVKKEIHPDFWNIGTRYDGNVTLREIITDDAEFMMQLVGDPKVTKYIPGIIQDRKMLISWIQCLSPQDHEYIVIIEETGEEIGECSLTEQGSSAEIGLMLLPQFWQRGYGTEMVNCLIEKARGMGIHDLTATTDSRNKAAVRLLEKCGFKKQKSGWRVMISEDADAELGDGQTVFLFQRNI